MNNSYQKTPRLSSKTNANEVRRFGVHRRSQVETLACRRLRRQYGISPSHAKLVAELAGLNG